MGGGGGGGELGSTAPESGLPTSLRPVTAIQVIGYTIEKKKKKKKREDFAGAQMAVSL